MEEQTKSFTDYLSTFRRRKKTVLGAAASLLAIAVAVAFLWPPSYRSIATILIEEQEIPPDLVRSTISSYADQRIQVISQQVMTRANLMQIIDKYNLYPGYRRTHATEDTLERMRKDIKLNIVKADVIDQRSGSKTMATIAFTLAYDGETPANAQKVANELVSLYLDENIKNREQKTAETFSFLAEESDRLAKHIDEVEKKLADFKSRNLGRLPELTQLNMQLRDRAESELKDVERQMLVLQDRKFYLDSELAQTKPNTPIISASGERILDPGERLKALQAQYASLSGVYSPSHPDIVKMRHEIDALQKETGTPADAQEREKQLVDLRADLATARDKYSDEHPDVARLKKSIAALEAQKPAPAAPAARAVKTQRGAKAQTAAEPVRVKAENPTYIALQGQLDATVSEMNSLRGREADLRSKMAMYESRIEQTPQVEREYLDLQRDQETSVARYREVKAKQAQAQISQELEKDRKGERFSLIDPPQVPEQPFSPNRPAILLLGLVLSLGGGAASAAVLDNLDHSVRGSRALARLVEAPVLAVIPCIETPEEKLRNHRTTRIAVVSSVAALILALIAVHFLWAPLDVLWFRGMRKFEAYASASALAWLVAVVRLPWNA